MSNVRKAKHGWIFTIIFTILSVLWVLPIVIVFMNSFKLKAYINRFPFQLGPFKMTDGWDRFVAGVQKAFVGLTNYAEGIRKINFFNAFGTSLFITICSVAVIILCTSMCAWYIIRVNDKFSKGLYCLCLFSILRICNLISANYRTLFRHIDSTGIRFFTVCPDKTVNT